MISDFFETQTKSKPKKEHFIWAEKYRPKNLTEYIGNEELIEQISHFIDIGDIPHLLFHGRAGTGKTSLAKLLVDNIDCDFLYINASDERGIDTIRNKVKEFGSTIGFKNLKVVILDESDFLTPEAQAALRNSIETFSRNTRFIFTCNEVARIIVPLVSRTQSYRVHPMSKPEIAKHLAGILQKENIKFELVDIANIVSTYHPDIRKILQVAQQQSVSGSLKMDDNSKNESEFKRIIIDTLKSDTPIKTKFNTIRQTVADAKLNLFDDVYRELYDKVDEYAPNNKAACILIISEFLYKDVLSIDKEINFMSCMINLIGESK